MFELANGILSNQFPEVNGFQSTLLTPVFDSKCHRWDYHAQLESRSSPSAQIHHDGNFHWVVSLKSGDTIYILDSLYKLTLSSSLQIQISKLYGCNKYVLASKI